MSHEQLEAPDIFWGEDMRVCRTCGKERNVGEYRAGRTTCKCCELDKHRIRVGSKLHKGDKIECKICGKSIIRNGPATTYCKDVCKPKEGFRATCTDCGESKGYGAFYDFRYNVDGRFVRTCRVCISRKNNQRHHRKREAEEARIADLQRGAWI